MLEIGQHRWLLVLEILARLRIRVGALLQLMVSRWLGHAALLPHALLLSLVFLDDSQVDHAGLLVLLDLLRALLQLRQDVIVVFLHWLWVQLWLTGGTWQLFVLVHGLVLLLPRIVVYEVLAPILVSGVGFVLGAAIRFLLGSEKIHACQ